MAGGRVAHRGMEGRAPSASSLRSILPGPPLFVVHLTFISSLWKNHQISQGVLLPQTGWEARNMQDQEQVTVGEKDHLTTGLSHSEGSQPLLFFGNRKKCQ